MLDVYAMASARPGRLVRRFWAALPAPEPRIAESFGLVEQKSLRYEIMAEDAQRLREKQCRLHGHDWTIIESCGAGPVRVLCDHCGIDSRLRRLEDA